MKFTTLTALFSLATAYPSYDYVLKQNSGNVHSVWVDFVQDVSSELQEELYNNWLAHIDEWTYFRDWNRDEYDVILTENLSDEETGDIYADVVADMIFCAQPYGLVPSDWKAKNAECVGGNIFQQLGDKYEAVRRAEYQAYLLENMEKKPAYYLEMKQLEAARAAKIAAGEEVEYVNGEYHVVKQFQ